MRQANAVPFDFMTVALSHAERKQLHEVCNNYKLYSTSSGPEGERRVLVSSAWKGIDKPMNACIGVGAVGYMVARKDSTGRMVRGKVSAHAIAGGAGRWTLRYEDGSTEEGVAIAELNHRLKGWQGTL